MLLSKCFAGDGLTGLPVHDVYSGVLLMLTLGVPPLSLLAWGTGELFTANQRFRSFLRSLESCKYFSSATRRHESI